MAFSGPQQCIYYSGRSQMTGRLHCEKTAFWVFCLELFQFVYIALSRRFAHFKMRAHINMYFTITFLDAVHTFFRVKLYKFISNNLHRNNSTEIVTNHNPKQVCQLLSNDVDF